jgi:prepilin-type N-terminal cleavage/methylation domain-containing protein
MQQNSALRLSPREGFTLVEMVIALTISSLIIAIFFGTIANMQKQYRGQRDTRMAEESLRTAEQVLRTVLQTAAADPRSTGQALIDPDIMANGGFNDIRVKSDFNPPDGDFNDELEDVRVKVSADTMFVQWNAAGSYQPLVYPVRSLTFEYFDNAGTPLTTAAAAANAKSVRFTISAPESPVSNILRSRETWVFLQNRRW